MLSKSSFLLLESFHHLFLSVLSGAVVNNPPVNAGDARDTGSISGSGRSPGGRRKWQPTPVSLLGKSHGQRSQAG